MDYNQEFCDENFRHGDWIRVFPAVFPADSPLDYCYVGTFGAAHKNSFSMKIGFNDHETNISYWHTWEVTKIDEAEAMLLILENV